MLCKLPADTVASVQLNWIAAIMQAAMNYAEEQQQDMLHLRRLFYGKLGQLSRVRAAMMAHMPAAVQSTPVSPIVDSTAKELADTKTWADQLCANHAEEGRAHFYCGVGLPHQ